VTGEGAMNREPLPDELVGLLAARRGHFRLESGHHGDLWLDLDALFLRPGSLRPFVAELARRLAAHHPDAVCGPLTGGAFLAQMVAAELGAEFYHAERIVRPRGVGPDPVGYRIPDALRPAVRGKAVAVVDDAINAGSAVRGTVADLHACGARPVAVGALLVLGDAAAAFAADRGVPLERIAHLPTGLWAPADCPLCAARVLLEDPAVSPAE
jgi:orotate phosphoribosyltransferase